MKIILLEDVKTLGKKGDIVEVKDGYARNAIIPKKLGIEATAKNINDLKLKKSNEDKVAMDNLEKAKTLASVISSKVVLLQMKVGEGGKTFGSISSKEIADACLTQHGIELDKKKIVIKEPIKALGTWDVQVKIHPKVVADLTVKVDAE